jgi:hypothetical protein
LRHLDSVIIGDVATCRKKMEGYRDIGVDRLMCLVQMGEVPRKCCRPCVALTSWSRTCLTRPLCRR